MKKFRIKNFIMLTFAGIAYAVAVTIFMTPVKLFDCGVSGTSMLVALFTPDWLTLPMFLLIFNIPLILYGLKKEGAVFTVYSLFAIGMYTLFAWLISDVLPIDVSTASPLAGKDILLCAVFGGFIAGIGSGLAIRFGGVIDGIEVMAVIYSKKLGITVGTFCMIYNAILYILCGILTRSWIVPLYSIITYAVALKTLDFIVEGFDRAKCAMIITTKPDKICNVLSETFESGVTKIKAKGGYSDTDKTVVYFVVNRFQVIKMKDLIHEIDPKAFITISDVADVFSSNSIDQ